MTNFCESFERLLECLVAIVVDFDVVVAIVVVHDVVVVVVVIDDVNKLFNQRHFDNSLKFDATNNLCPNKLTSRWGGAAVMQSKGPIILSISLPMFQSLSSLIVG